MTERATAVDWRHVVSTALGVLAGAVATAGTLAVAVAGFTLSYDAIRKVGIASGVRPDWAWLLPVSIDGAMAVGTVTAVVMSRMGKQVWYPWAVVLAGAGISIACNALHAQMRDLIQLDDRTAMAVSAIPAVMLALSVHLLVVLIDAAARTLNGPSIETNADTPADVPAVEQDAPTRTASELEVGHDASTSVAPVPPPASTPTRTRTAATKRARTGTATKGRTATKTGTRTDDELLEALADVPRDPDGTVPVRRAAAALGTGPDRARKLLSTAGLLRTEPPAEPAPTPVNGTPLPELIDAARRPS